MLDISDELLLNRTSMGIQLIKPSKHVTAPAVSTVMQLPMQVYFENKEGVIQKTNEKNALFCGYDSPQHANGKIYYRTLDAKIRNQLRENDQQTMQSNQLNIFDEIVQSNEGNRHGLSIKYPWYDNKNTLIGLFGFSIMLDQQSLAQALLSIMGLGLLSYHEPKFVNSIKLSKQQKICGELLVKGHSIRKIAEQLNLSARTVETYINNLKAKLKCRNKTELTLKLAAHFDLHGLTV